MSVNKTRRSRTDDRDESGKCFNAFFSAENHISNSATIIFQFLPSPSSFVRLFAFRWNFEHFVCVHFIPKRLQPTKGMSENHEKLLFYARLNRLKCEASRRKMFSFLKKNLYIHVICVQVGRHSTFNTAPETTPKGLVFPFPTKRHEKCWK